MMHSIFGHEATSSSSPVNLFQIGLTAVDNPYHWEHFSAAAAAALHVVEGAGVGHQVVVGHQIVEGAVVGHQVVVGHQIVEGGGVGHQVVVGHQGGGVGHQVVVGHQIVEGVGVEHHPVEEGVGVQNGLEGVGVGVEGHQNHWTESVGVGVGGHQVPDGVVHHALEGVGVVGHQLPEEHLKCGVGKQLMYIHVQCT